jgi:hypothetical protein
MKPQTLEPLVRVHFGASDFKVGASTGDLVIVGLVTGAPGRFAGARGSEWSAWASELPQITDRPLLTSVTLNCSALAMALGAPALRVGRNIGRPPLDPSRSSPTSSAPSFALQMVARLWMFPHLMKRGKSMVQASLRSVPPNCKMSI